MLRQRDPPSDHAHVIGLVHGDALAIVGGDDGPVLQLHRGGIPAVHAPRGCTGLAHGRAEKDAGCIPAQALIAADAGMDTELAPKA